MTSYSITNCKADLEAMLHGTTLNQIVNLYGLFNRAAGDILLDVDAQETKRTVQLANQIFYQVYDYNCPSDLKGNCVIDIKPQLFRYPYQIWSQTYNQEFDVAKNWTWDNNFTIDFNTAVKTLRINAPLLQQGVIVNQLSSVTGNGTWSVGGGASTIETNNINFINFGGSVQFNLLAGQASGYIENSTFSTQNLSEQLNQGTEFLYVYFPDASDVTSVDLRWGSSSGDYYSRTVTTDHQGNAFVDGWNQLSFAWDGATVTGAPDPSAIGYARITFAYNSTLQTGVLVNSYASRMGVILECEYYSRFLFRDGLTGAFKENVTSDNDLVNLDTETRNLFLYKVCQHAVQQQQGVNALQFDAQYFEKKYADTLRMYKARYKSEIQKPQQVYYAKNNYNYSNYYARGIN